MSLIKIDFKKLQKDFDYVYNMIEVELKKLVIQLENLDGIKAFITEETFSRPGKDDRWYQYLSVYFKNKKYDLKIASDSGFCIFNCAAPIETKLIDFNWNIEKGETIIFLKKIINDISNENPIKDLNTTSKKIFDYIELLEEQSLKLFYINRNLKEIIK